MSFAISKNQREFPLYELLYHPGIPGRGEFVRLAFEAAGVSYVDIANEKEDGYDIVKRAFASRITGIEGNPPGFAPPMLRIPGAGKDGGYLLISQTANILSYIGPKIGMAPDDEFDQVHVSGIAMTALDMNNETHDTHHPVSVMAFYEDQKDESLKKASDFRTNRMPKYFSYFERILEGNEERSNGKYLVGDRLTFADTTVWQIVDGLYFAFPKEMKAREKEFPRLLMTFYPGVKEESRIKEYLSSDRRKEYSMGIFRRYPELDRND